MTNRKTSASPAGPRAASSPGARSPFRALGPTEDRVIIPPRVIPYKAQDRSANCGAYGVYNMLLFLGMNPKVIDIYKIETGVKCDSAMGTTSGNITRFLRQICVKFTEVRGIKIRQIEDALFAGHGVLYLYNFSRFQAHYVFIYGQTRHHFWVANELGETRNMDTLLRRKSYYVSKTNKYPTFRKMFGRFPHGWVVKGWRSAAYRKPKVKKPKPRSRSRKRA